LRDIKKILIIIQRSNGDVLLSQTLIRALHEHYNSPHIDLLVNDDTLEIAQLMPNIDFIHKFSYEKKSKNRWKQELQIICSIYRKYELSINLTASDRSVFYSLFASKNSISAVEKEKSKSWWKVLLLRHHYYFDSNKHIFLNNLESLKKLKIKKINIIDKPLVSKNSITKVRKMLDERGVTDFVIFHPSAQYKYKIYPRKLRNELLIKLSGLDFPVVVTGSKNEIDMDIKSKLPKLSNIFDLIGETSLEDYFALSELSLGYIGMDTLNMHIAAAQNKQIFAIFGPTNLTMWSPWSNEIKKSASENKPIQKYANITIFQANMPCVACGNAGCDDKHGKSECLDHINPLMVFKEVNNWLQDTKL